MVLRLLKNEKYCGDLLQKKYRTTDHLTHRKIVNDGAEEQFCLRDHHEAIVSRSQFQAVQEELARRSRLTADRNRFSARYWYSGKIRCGACGRSLTLKRTRRPDGTEYRRFVCRGRLEGSGGCQMRAVRAEELFACTQYVLEAVALDRRAMLGGAAGRMAGLAAAGRHSGEDSAGPPAPGSPKGAGGGGFSGRRLGSCGHASGDLSM